MSLTGWLSHTQRGGSGRGVGQRVDNGNEGRVCQWTMVRQYTMGVFTVIPGVSRCAAYNRQPLVWRPSNPHRRQVPGNTPRGDGPLTFTLTLNTGETASLTAQPRSGSERAESGLCLDKIL